MLDYTDEFYCGNGNGNKMNLRVEILENLLKANGDEAGGRTTSSAKVNSLRQAIHRCKTDMAETLSSSLDLLRQVFQAEMTEEIRQVIDRHLRTTFSPALENLKRNGYKISDDELNELCVSILDAAKEPFKQTTREEKERANRMVIPSGSVLKPKNNQNLQNTPNFDPRRVYESDDNESDTSMASFGNVSQFPNSARFHRPKKRGRPRKVDVDSGRSGTPIMNGTQPITFAEAFKWNPERIHKDSKFVLGSKVNKLLCMGHRGHIFVKYPRIFRYVGDDEDKGWLFDRNISTRMSGKVFFMLLEDGLELATLESAQPNVRSDLHRCSFTVPEQTIAKMKIYMTRPFDSLKSRIAPASPLHIASNSMISGPIAQSQQMISPNVMNAAISGMVLHQPHATNNGNNNLSHQLSSNVQNALGTVGNGNLNSSLINLLSGELNQTQRSNPNPQLHNINGLNSALNNLQLPDQMAQSHVLNALNRQSNGLQTATDLNINGSYMSN
ncbi:DNTTIP1-dimer domain-containing protein [Aphelenchoides besseyi]|nr:DNTTIP1-dimer domain-containing protein [Aphelenchoides besseyi]KAI6235699.1 DNTTIP1-dimer domain-containing protein [Aphelenchoides besseyi]